MAAFSTSRKSLFGAPLVADMLAPSTAPTTMPNMAAVAPSTHPEMSPKPIGTGRMIAGYVGDALARWGGGQALFAPIMEQRQRAQQQAAQYQRERTDKFADFQREYDYRAAHPIAPQPTEFERVAQAAGYQPGTPEYIALMKQRAETQASAPPMVVTNPDGTRTIYPSGSIPRGPMTPPAAPVGKLTPMGGAGSQGPGSFPLR